MIPRTLLCAGVLLLGTDARAAVPLPACADLVEHAGPAAPPPPRFSVAPVPAAPGIFTTTALGLLATWRGFLTRADGASCRFYPTCAGYATQAFAHRHPGEAMLLAAGRIIRNHGGPRYPLCLHGGTIRVLDPLPEARR